MFTRRGKNGINDFKFGTFVGCVWRDGAASMAEKGLIGDGGEKGTESSPAVKFIQIVLLLLPCSVQLQHYEDSDTLSACWVIWVFP